MATRLIVWIDEPARAAVTEAAAQRLRRLLRNTGIAKASSRITIKTHTTHKEDQ